MIFSLGTEQTCAIDDCHRPARKAGLCWGHYKRQQRNKRLERTKPVSTPLRDWGHMDLEKLRIAFDKFADIAESTEVKEYGAEWRKAVWRLEYALQRYRRRAQVRYKRRVGR